MSPILGIWASADQSQFISTNSYESIATATGTGSSGTITFTSIPSTYKHLQIRATYFPSASINPYMRVGNGTIDSGANYSWHHLFGDGASAASNGSGSQSFTYCGYSTNSTNPLISIIDILDYTSANKNKTFRILAGQDNNGSGEVALWSGAWFNSASSIDTISIIVSSGTFSTASKFALYGIKGA